jgi:hypothetical protein
LPLELHDQTATLTGVTTVEEVELLVAWLHATSKPRVNLKQCTHLHTGAFQAMLFFRPKVSAAPADVFLATQLMPVLTQPRPPAAS